ncbi:MAG: divergent polysaccharide deacetylase family protein [Candidatus Omnitrophica bacterium]|nr:divergent polysaccharide deacetylase family protein [Candidatus Omnitrophota bacterium]
MTKTLRIALLIILIVGPIFFYRSLNKKKIHHLTAVENKEKVAKIEISKSDQYKPTIAIIFDNFGESLNALKDVHSLGIPVTVSVIPNLRFSKNIAHIATRCGHSVFIHLPLQPVEEKYQKTDKYRFISSDLNKKDKDFLLKRYLNSTRIAIGVNNHMGSKATKNEDLMRMILKEIKDRGLIFVDSRTSEESVGYEIALEEGVACGYNEGFLDDSDDMFQMKERMDVLINKSREKGKIIVIAHPKENTIQFFKNELPKLQGKVDFITMKEFFDL